MAAPRRRAARAALLLALASAACVTRAQGGCTPDDLDRATTPELARALSMRCENTPSIRFRALDKLNAMPLPADIPAFAEKSLGTGSIERASFAMDVFFGLDEAYPIPIGLDKLAELVERIGGIGVIDAITISSSENAMEQGASTDVAVLRTDFVRRYLVAAGIDANRIHGMQQNPDHADTTEGRARDRCARIQVFMHRARTTP
jgi:hypothetical protein